jgi:hypothetical protein
MGTSAARSPYQRTGKDTADREDFMRAMENCIVCETEIELELLVVTGIQ